MKHCVYAMFFFMFTRWRPICCYWSETCKAHCSPKSFKGRVLHSTDVCYCYWVFI